AVEARSALANSAAEQSTEILKRLRAHVANTYCIHRRMIRTRRKYLIEELGIGASRVEQTVEFELDEDWRRRLWELLEEWRIEAASRTARDGSQLIETYIEFAEA